MKFLIKILLIAAISYVGQMFLPFWVVAIAGLLVSLVVKTNGFTAFLSGFIGVFGLWFLSAYFINENAQGILSEKMVTIIPVGSVLMLIILTAVIGGLVGGFGALTGSIVHSTFARKKVSGY